MTGTGRPPVRTEGSRWEGDPRGAALAALGDGWSSVDGGGKRITVGPMSRTTNAIASIEGYPRRVTKWILCRIPIPEATRSTVPLMAGVCGEGGTDRDETGFPTMDAAGSRRIGLL